MPSVKHILSSVARAIGFLFIGFIAIVLIIAGLSMLFGPPVSPGEMQVVTVTGTLEENPDVQVRGRNATSATNVRLLLNEYPNRSFNIDGDAFSAAKWVPLGQDVYAGDTVVMEVSADDYKSNIKEQTTPSGMLSVAVYAIQSKGYVYLSLADYCKEANDNTGAAIVALVMGCSIVFAFYYEFRKKKIRKDKRKLTTIQNQPN
ncbi:MAG: hypothetical protein K0Q79_3172 [Flavipsychrobacter sp.]|jgi:phosphotransferase system  glucose/maltose/N-acetylglucosamine-specific IIC component|nr:hypothetical protein [Flavipsychrobacter sp.]